ncbi:hypothetical protein GUITHDRAFT_101615 [Guillardia theta CCMP2712]|uniref:Uncharacterized protein n=1 Tax=Guillardia theta (strain CCMP2712) TaxID=905079 RepID=L1JWH2_GUITC|nr:hypothetical protein GUITHDRAFT_101615 [Guillardia theta CCMP2712]EKX52443.1 hypothetical protein GUITHDRAFT_101615 [Guillardia theta CCMP2712]|eukprot:XP_005839423.1 hypothetical protein GUITHDRAFT_101615 [Guillardia theta CCMP2712]
MGISSGTSTRVISPKFEYLPGNPDINKFSISPVSLATAGINIVVPVFARDTFGNLISSSVHADYSLSVARGGVTQAVISSESTAGGQMGVSFLLTLAAQYSVLIMGNGTELQGTPFSISVIPAIISGQQCIVTGTALTSTMAGKQAGMVIQAVDQYGNQRTDGGVNFFFAAEGPLERATSNRAQCSDSSAGSCGITRQQTAGSCSVTFTLTIAGTYSVSLNLVGDYTGGSTIGSSPYNITIQPNTDTLPGFVAVDPITASSLAGVPLNLNLHESDQYGNERNCTSIRLNGFSFTSPTSGSSFSASTAFVGTSDQVCVVSLSMTNAGSYAPLLSILGQSIASTKINISIFAGPIGNVYTSVVNKLSSGESFDASQGFVDAMVNGDFVPQQYTNRYGNVLKRGGFAANISVNVSSQMFPYSIRGSVADLEDGYYMVSYTTTVSGGYQIFIDVDGNSIKNTPFQALILSGAIESSQCYACLLDSTGCRRGQRGDRDATCTRSLKAVGEEVLLCAEASQVTPASLYVRLADRFGNDITDKRELNLIRYSVSFSSSSVQPKVFNNILCFLDGAGCSSATLLDATNIDSLGGFIGQSANWLYPVSFVGSVSGSYSLEILLGSKNASGQAHFSSISQSVVRAEVLPSSPCSSYSVAAGSSLSLSTAGHQSTFLILTRDAFNNDRVGIVKALDAEISLFDFSLLGPSPDAQTLMTPGQSAPFIIGQVKNESGGLFSASFSSTIAGTYSLRLKLGGQHLVNSPFTLQVNPAPASPNSSRVVSSLQLTVVSGKFAPFLVQAYDPFGNRIFTSDDQFTGAMPDQLNAHVEVQPLTQGQHNVSFLMTQAGQYVAHVRLQGQDILDSPVSFIVVAGPAASQTSIVNSTDILALGTVGEHWRFKIHGFDKFSNLRTTGDDPFSVLVYSPIWADCSNCSNCSLPDGSTISRSDCLSSPPRNGVCSPCPSRLAAVVDLSIPSSCSQVLPLLGDFGCKGGTYLADFVPTKSGTYAVTAFLSGASVSPVMFTFTVFPGVPDPAFSKVEPDGKSLTLITAGVQHSFLIKSFDRFMNSVQYSLSSSFLLSVTPFLSSQVLLASSTYEDLGSGLFRQTFLLSISGSYKVNVFLDSKAVVGSPFNVTVISAGVNASNSIPRGLGFTLATAGMAGSFFIQTRDSFGNWKTAASAGNWQISVLRSCAGQEATTFVPVVNDLQDGTYAVVYTITVSGRYCLVGSDGSTQLSGTPSELTVLPGSASPHYAAPSGSALSSTTVGVVSSFLIQSADMFGNVKTRGGDVYQVELKGGWRVAADSSVAQEVTVTGEVEDKADGSYVARYLTTRSGSFAVHIFLLSGTAGAREEIDGSPRNISVLPGQLDISHTAVFSFNVVNPALARTLCRSLLIGGGPWIPGKVYNSSSVGVITGELFVTQAGLYRVLLSSANVSAAGFPLNISFLPGDPTVSNFFPTFPEHVVCTHPQGCNRTRRVATAGENSAFMVTSVDEFGNMGDMLAPPLLLTYADSYSPSILYRSDKSVEGVSTILVNITKKGTYNLTVVDLQGTSIRLSPFLFSVVPADLFPPLCTAVGNGITVGRLELTRLSRS